MDRPLTQAERIKITFDSYLVRIDALILRMNNVKLLFKDDYNEDVMNYFDSIIDDLQTFKAQLDDEITEIQENIALGFEQLEGAGEDLCEDNLARMETLLFNFERCAKVLSNPPLKEGTYNIGTKIDEGDPSPIGPIN